MRINLVRGAAAICLAMTALAVGACGPTAGGGPAPTTSATVAAEPVVPSPEASADTTGDKGSARLEAFLPEVPEPWTLVPQADVSDDHLSLSYTRPDGPDLKFRGEVTGDSGEPDSYRGQQPLARVKLGSHQGYIYPIFGSSLEVIWRAGDIQYRMVGVPSEGGSMTVAEFKRVISQLRWP